MPISKLIFAAAALALATACSLTPAKSAPPPPAAEALALEPLEVVTASGPVRFEVEIARTDAEKARGLMFRSHLADDRGMLFVYERAQPASFWMRNTWIPLDIIFIGANGRILNIAENTTPYSEEPIPSAGAVRGVLEIRGGRARELSIEPGDKVHHGIFPRD